jgi:hypothetical protein
MQVRLIKHKNYGIITNKLKFSITVKVDPEYFKRLHDAFFEQIFTGGRSYAADYVKHFLTFEVDADNDDKALMNFMNILFPYDQESVY